MVFEVKGIEKRYNNKTILHNISFEIPESNITVILGKNGAGKTTLIMTTRLTGGLNRGYKPRLQASASRRWLSLCSSLIAFDSSLAS